MLNVILKLPALLTVSECRSIRNDNSKRFQLYKLGKDGDLDKWLPLVDTRSKSRRQFYPAYYSAHLCLRLPAGDYAIIAGERPIKFYFFNVSKLGTVSQIPNPQHRKVSL